jgi:hypothetical protein
MTTNPIPKRRLDAYHKQRPQTRQQLQDDLNNLRLLMAHIKASALGRWIVRKASKHMPAQWTNRT